MTTEKTIQEEIGLEQKYEIVFEIVAEEVKDLDDVNNFIMQYDDEIEACETIEELKKLGAYIRDCTHGE